MVKFIPPRRKIWDYATTIMAVVLLIALPINANSQGKIVKVKKSLNTTRVSVDPVKHEIMRQTVPVIGRFLARQIGAVAARTPGVIEKFHADVGDRVVKGDVIAVLMKERLVWKERLQNAEVEHYAAQVRTKKRQIKLFQQELARLRSLRNSPAFSQARLDDKIQEVLVAESAVAEANARLNMAKATLRLTTINLNDAEIRAPFSGIISKRPTEVGTYVVAGTPVAIIINDHSMEIEAEIPSIRIKHLKTNMTIAAEFQDFPLFNASIRAIIPDENPRTRTRAVRLTANIGNEFTTVAFNQSVTLYVPTGPTKNVVTVHKDAILVKNSKRVVFVANDNKAEMRFIKLGEANGSRFSVIHGLKPKELVIIRGNERLRPGATISYNNKVEIKKNHQTSKPEIQLNIKK